MFLFGSYKLGRTLRNLEATVAQTTATPENEYKSMKSGAFVYGLCLELRLSLLNAMQPKPLTSYLQQTPNSKPAGQLQTSCTVENIDLVVATLL